MIEKNSVKQPAAPANGNKKKPFPLLPVLLSILVLAIIYLVLSLLGVFDTGRKTVETITSSYQLYAPNDTKKTAMLFFGATQGEDFKILPVEIYESDLQINRIKQLLITLTQGPQDNTAINLLPEGSMLLDAYIDANSIVYIDMSQEFAANCKGGTTGEYQAVYSLLNTVFYNFSFIKGARITVNGAEKDSLAGHISLKSIFTRDTDLSRYK